MPCVTKSVRVARPALHARRSTHVKIELCSGSSRKHLTTRRWRHLGEIGTRGRSVSLGVNAKLEANIRSNVGEIGTRGEYKMQFGKTSY